ncbi:DUF418 domain-containing protein [Flavobacterium gawalongense]|uniref:DUF418 domain-containing protein n=1 Tax=Flavobacterium gawalongense TaxID=2594432 RepID=UPI001C3FB8DC|nr:DUF418 domain-containing protein [Flavobacterium gawalongense]
MTNITFNLKAPRIEVVDALRGFAIMSIMLLHNVEHFEYYYLPENFPTWLVALDKIVWDSLFFLFGGKSYAIFALLFGFSFYIQNDNQAKKGNDFRGRFFWRMMLLLIFGIVNTAFYQGDILTLYAFLGLLLIPVVKWSNKAVFITAVVLMLQPLEWARCIYYILNPDYVAPPNLSNAYYESIGYYMKNGSFMDYVIGNLTLGKIASLLWSWENGRFFQAPALFMFGMLLGRKQLFTTTVENTQFWNKVLRYAIVFFIPLYFLKTHIVDIIARVTLSNTLTIIFASWSNVAFMLVLVSVFVLLYQKDSANRVFSKLIPFGKMSLTNYIMQSMIGAFIYYRYGLGLFEYTGATYCLLIGIVLFIIQLSFCTWWLKTHRQGPLEYIWHKATWISFGKK